MVRRSFAFATVPSPLHSRDACARRSPHRVREGQLWRQYRGAVRATDRSDRVRVLTASAADASAHVFALDTFRCGSLAQHRCGMIPNVDECVIGDENSTFVGSWQRHGCSSFTPTVTLGYRFMKSPAGDGLCGSVRVAEMLFARSFSGVTPHARSLRRHTPRCRDAVQWTSQLTTVCRLCGHPSCRCATTTARP